MHLQRVFSLALSYKLDIYITMQKTACERYIDDKSTYMVVQKHDDTTKMYTM